MNVETRDGNKLLEIPLWFWNTDEWCGFTKASPKTHRTTIVHALKTVRSGINVDGQSKERELSNYVRVIIQAINISVKDGLPF